MQFDRRSNCTALRNQLNERRRGPERNSLLKTTPRSRETANRADRHSSLGKGSGGIGWKDRPDQGPKSAWKVKISAVTPHLFENEVHEAHNSEEEHTSPENGSPAVPESSISLEQRPPLPVHRLPATLPGSARGLRDEGVATVSQR